MRVPVQLVNEFRERFETTLSQFAVEQKLIDSVEQLTSERFLSRSLVPHILKLSEMFNRMKKEETEGASGPARGKKGRASEQGAGLDPYWKDSSNPENFRLAYFLYFMPPNAFRVASVLAELTRLGFRWPFEKTFRAIEFGAGPASGATGLIEAAELTGFPNAGEVALIEQDRSVLQLGTRWAETLAQSKSLDWSFRPFHRKVTLKDSLLPRAAPKFQLWLSSFFLNEFDEDPELLLDRLLECWDRHVDDEGLIVLVEPALKLQSRKLLDLRRRLLDRLTNADAEKLRRGKGEEAKCAYSPKAPYQVLVPCLGHQACGALAAEDDWCHEEVTWWRPGYYRKLDEMAGLDRKTLPFSYLVLAKSRRSLVELLPALEGLPTHRLVSPSHYEGRDQEFFLCGAEGKRRARMQTETRLDRGSILLEAEVRGDSRASRVDRVKKILPQDNDSSADQ